MTSRRPSSRAKPVAPFSRLPTVFLLMAQYGGRAVIQIDEVCRDFFGDITEDQLLRKIASGEESLLMTRLGSGRKAPKVVVLSDLADWVDRQIQEAERAVIAWQNLPDPKPRHRFQFALLAEEITRLPRHKMRDAAPGIYFLWDGDECVYVGQSLNVHTRVRSHERDPNRPKIFDSYSWIPCSEDRLLPVEAGFIRRLTPRYNIAGAITRRLDQ